MPNRWKPSFETQDVKILDTQLHYQGFMQLYKISVQFRLFKGGLSKPVLREVVERPSAVTVLLYDPEHKQVVLIEELRIGALGNTQSPWLLDVVAGAIESSDTPEQAAIREVFEETGLQVSSLIPIGSYLPSPGIFKGQVFLYCAKVQAPKSGGIYGLTEEGEDIKVHVFSVEETLELLAAGHIVSAPAWISLQWLQLQMIQNKL